MKLPVNSPRDALTHVTDSGEMSDMALQVSDLASAWPFDDDLSLILSKPLSQSHSIL